jgi:lysophospholipase L1-like esterase
MTRARGFDIAAIVLAIAIAVGIASLSCSGTGTRPVATPFHLPNEQSQGLARPSVLFIGDSYTAGKGSAEMSYGCMAAVRMGWLCKLSALGGTGYISGGAANRWVLDQNRGESSSFVERIPRLAAKYDPAVVVLDGGRNDDFPPRWAVFDAMIWTIAEAHRTWPQARIVFIRPRFLARPNDDLSFDDLFMARLESKPMARDAIFIDPISSFAGGDTSKLMSSDGVHPNRRGDQQIATALVDALVAHDVVVAS